LIAFFFPRLEPSSPKSLLNASVCDFNCGSLLAVKRLDEADLLQRFQIIDRHRGFS
jgi:hypothetical protein